MYDKSISRENVAEIIFVAFTLVEPSAGIVETFDVRISHGLGRSLPRSARDFYT